MKLAQQIMWVGIIMILLTPVMGVVWWRKQNGMYILAWIGTGAVAVIVGASW